MNTLPSPPQQPNAGIAAGNPQPLPTQQSRPQQPQQFDLSQYPDLATALHAMKVLQDEKNKQVQQGMQAGAQAQQQPSVIQQLNQTLQRIEGQKQAEKQAKAQAGLAQLFAAAKQGSGAGVDQLPSGLGDNYAGGGIVAFSGKDDDQLVDTDAINTDTSSQILPSGIYEAALARARSGGNDKPSNEDIKKALAASALPLAAAGDVALTPAKLLERGARFSFPTLFDDKSQPSSWTPMMDARARYLGLDGSPAPTESKAMPEPIVAEGMSSGRLPSKGGIAALAASKPAPTQAPDSTKTGANTKTSVSVSSNGGYNPEDFTTQLQDEILRGMKKDPSAQADAETEKNRQLLGMEPILADRRKRAEGIEALMNQQRDARNPMQKFLLGMAKGPMTGGFGLQAAAGAENYDTAQQGWAKEDLANKMAIGKMQDDIDAAKLAGNEKLVQSRTQALADYVREKTGYVTAGATESSRIENAKLRLQQAQISHKQSLDAAAAREDNKTLSILQMGFNQAQQNAARATTIAEKAYADTIEGRNGKPFDSNTYYNEQFEKALRENPAYAHAQKKLGIASTVTAPPQEKEIPLSAEQKAHVNKYLK